MNFENIVVFSPHIDDAFFSLGGFIKQSIQYSNIHIINVFSETRYVACRSYYGLNGISYIRKCEEARNIIALKNNTSFSITQEFYNIPDADIRFDGSYNDYPRYISGGENILDNYCQLFENTMKKFSLENTCIFLPNGVGEHLDHVLLKKYLLKSKILSKYVKFFYYELPYINFNSTFPKKIISIPIDFNTKKEMILNYDSQIIKGDIPKFLNLFGNDKECYEYIKLILQEEENE